MTTYGRDEGNRFSLPAEYVDAVRRAGAMPFLLAPGERAIPKVLDQLDALILTGGGDLDPSRYGGAQHPAVYMVDRERDDFEIELVHRVLNLGKPTLCICRGAQVLNVALGGTLIEHLPDEVGEVVAHRLPPREPTPHGLRIEAGSHLARVVDATEVTAASWHHQAIREIGKGLRVVARAPDDTVEAVELPEHPWMIAVQWHPELTAAADPIQQRLFDGLAGAVTRSASEGERSS